MRGVIPSRSSEETVRKVAAVLKAAGNQHAFGGLAAAWMLDGFADFRIATCYVDGSLDPSALKEVGFLEGERGANLWLMMDADPVAFMGATRIRATHVASPFFTYVDLAAHPERSREAAGHLLEHILGLEASHAV